MQWCLSKHHSVLDASVIFALHRAVLGGHLFCPALFCLCPASLASAYSGESKPHMCPGGSEVFPPNPLFHWPVHYSTSGLRHIILYAA